MVALRGGKMQGNIIVEGVAVIKTYTDAPVPIRRSFY